MFVEKRKCLLEKENVCWKKKMFFGKRKCLLQKVNVS